MMPFFGNSSLRAYGRPSTIFFASASPIPGRAFNSSSDALLISSGFFFASVALVSVLAGSFLAGASVFGCASAGETTSETAANRTAINTATSLDIGGLLVTGCERRYSVGPVYLKQFQ